MSRENFLKSLFDVSGVGLEIGPSHAPLLPKKEGYNIEILDHLSREDLIKKYKNALSVDLSNIESVDYVMKDKSLHETVNKSDHYDFIVASHVIEHIYNMIGFLNDCEKLLKKDGKLILAIPDKRFSFDVLRTLSSTGDFIQAHIEDRKCHTVGRLFDEVMYNSLRGGAAGWGAADTGDLDFHNSFEKAKELFDLIKEDINSVDIHAWQFTPSSFRLIIHDLQKADFIPLFESEFHDAKGEFYCVLGKTGPGVSVPRITLAQRIMDEQSEIHVKSSS